MANCKILNVLVFLSLESSTISADVTGCGVTCQYIIKNKFKFK